MGRATRCESSEKKAGRSGMSETAGEFFRKPGEQRSLGGLARGSDHGRDGVFHADLGHVIIAGGPPLIIDEHLVGKRP